MHIIQRSCALLSFNIGTDSVSNQPAQATVSAAPVPFLFRIKLLIGISRVRCLVSALLSCSLDAMLLSKQTLPHCSVIPVNPNLPCCCHQLHSLALGQDWSCGRHYSAVERCACEVLHVFQHPLLGSSKPAVVVETFLPPLLLHETGMNSLC